MAGQYIYLEEVTAAASAGAARIEMSDADLVATKITSLKHAISARSLVAVPTGGVAGRCRWTGEPLLPKGSAAASLTLSEVSGHLALGINGTSAAGLALPADSLTPSYTMVAAVNLAAADVEGGLIVNLLSGFDAAGVYTSVLQRSYGVTNPGANKGKLCSSPLAGGNFSVTSLPAAGWAITIVDYDSSTKVASVAVNQAELFGTLAMPGSFTPTPGSYVEVGYHLDSNSLRSSKLGHLYTFDDSLLRTELGRAQAKALVAALKAQYGIA